MGNVTITPKRKNYSNNRVRQSFDVGFTGTYATNGDTIAAAELAKLVPDRKVVTDLNFVDLFISELGALGYALYFDRTNLKVKVFNGTTEIANATNLTAVVVRCIAEFGDDPATTV